MPTRSTAWTAAATSCAGLRVDGDVPAEQHAADDTGHLELIRAWFGRPLWEMQPGDADAYFGRVLRDARPSTRTGRAAALAVYFQFLELRHKIELLT